jgi:hypothetical protein
MVFMGVPPDRCSIAAIERSTVGSRKARLASAPAVLSGRSAVAITVLRRATAWAPAPLAGIAEAR